MASISFSGATGGTCADKEKIVQTVIVAATVIAVCFVAEIAVVAVLLARRRSSNRSWKKQPLPEKQGNSSSREQSIEILDDSESKQLPATPGSSMSSEFVDIAIRPPTPLLHTHFPSIPATPVAPVDTSGPWVEVNGMDRLTVVSLADSTEAEAESSANAELESELVASLRARIQELEMQNKLRDASWYTSRAPPSYKSKRN